MTDWKDKISKEQTVTEKEEGTSETKGEGGKGFYFIKLLVLF